MEIDGLEESKWQERLRKAKEESDKIRARAKAESRELTLRECVGAILDPARLEALDNIRRDALRGPLHPAQFQILRLLVKHGMPEAKELLQICKRVGMKKRKPFGEIVKATPRQDGESFLPWLRRIWDECDKYATEIPEEVTEELLARYARGNSKDRSGNGDSGNSTKARGRRSCALL